MARSPITFSTTGNFNKTTAFLNKILHNHILNIMEKYGSRGVSALSQATPSDTGLAARSWYYTVGSQNGQYWIDFHNNDIEGGAPVVILIQYGHGTRNGGYVVGKDFINSVIQPIFDQIKADVWKEVSSL